MDSAVRLNALAEVIKKYEEILTNKGGFFTVRIQKPILENDGDVAGISCLSFQESRCLLRNMNKITSIIFRESKPISLYFSHITHHKKCLHSLHSHAASCILAKKENQNQQVPLSFERQISFLTKLKTRLSDFISDNTKSKAGGCLAYEKIADDINYIEFIQRFELPDTFQSWFLILQLHVWITISATISERKGKLFKLSLVDSMWNDVELRMEKLAVMKSSNRKKYLKELMMEFQAGLISYDEGILNEDTVLAAATWRMLFECKPVHPQLLENAVLYIRKQLAHLESQNVQDIIFRGSVSFLPLNNILSDVEM